MVFVIHAAVGISVHLRKEPQGDPALAVPPTDTHQ